MDEESIRHAAAARLQSLLQVLQADAIRRVYGIAVRVLSHPETGRPIIVPDVAARIDALSAEVAR